MNKFLSTGLKRRLVTYAPYVVLFILLGATFTGISFKVGYQGSTGQWWGWTNNDNGLITTSGGKAYASTGLGFMQAQWSLNSSGGIVYLNGAIITSSTTLYPVNHTTVIGDNATLIIDTDANVQGVIFFDSNNVTWKDITIKRRGTVTGGVNAIRIYSGTENTVRFYGCRFINEITENIASCRGCLITDAAAPVLYDCYAKGGGNGNEGDGFASAGSSSPQFFNCRGYASDGTTDFGSGFACFGTDSTASLFNCYGKGSLNADYSPGLGIREGAHPIVTGGLFEGGDCPNYGFGVYMDETSHAILNGVTGIGGGGDGAEGIQIKDDASPRITGCTFQGGSLGVSCNGAGVYESSCPIFQSCLIKGQDGRGILIDTDDYALFVDTTFLSVSGDAVFIDDTAIAANLFKFIRCTFNNTDASGHYAIKANLVMSSANFFDCFLHNLRTKNIGVLGGVISNSNHRTFPPTPSGLQSAIWNCNSTLGGEVQTPYNFTYTEPENNYNVTITSLGDMRLPLHPPWNPVNGSIWFVTGNQTIAVYWDGSAYYFENDGSLVLP